MPAGKFFTLMAIHMTNILWVSRNFNVFVAIIPKINIQSPPKNINYRWSAMLDEKLIGFTYLFLRGYGRYGSLYTLA